MNAEKYYCKQCLTLGRGKFLEDKQVKIMDYSIWFGTKRSLASVLEFGFLFSSKIQGRRMRGSILFSD